MRSQGETTEGAAGVCEQRAGHPGRGQPPRQASSGAQVTAPPALSLFDFLGILASKEERVTGDVEGRANRGLLPRGTVTGPVERLLPFRPQHAGRPQVWTAARAPRLHQLPEHGRSGFCDPRVRFPCGPIVSTS